MTTFAPRRIASVLALLLLGAVTSPVHATGPADEKPLSALFLGDPGSHHRPLARSKQLIPVMATRGIDITYSEVMDDLNLANLAKYDVVLIYANIEKADAKPMQALVEYVENGGGLAPIHCASYCFLNSPEYIALVGGQFKSHGTGEFDVKDVAPDNPILKGLKPFRTWDETYVHTKLNMADRTLLQVRDEKGKDEPWTWTRTQGKGRVFYTAYGHDERTWGQPGFQNLVERGIRWAAHKGEVFDSSPKVAATAPVLKLEDAPAPIPSYVQGAAWGTAGKAITLMQLPASPSDSIQHLAVPKGLEPRLFASEPDIAKPIAMAWDHKGRLWIAETFDYPNNIQPKGQGHDQIKICEDTDGDGVADKFTVFADKLSIPTSLTFAGGGLIIHQAPDTLLLKDTDGDDKADVRQVLLSGWGTDDTHAGPSNLRYGFDNWVYGIVGYSGFLGEIGGEHHNFKQALYRFRPDGSKLEVLRNTNNNSWGVGMSEEGLLFGSTANGCPSVYVPIPYRYYEKVRGMPTPGVLASIADTNRYFPITEKVRQVDYFGGFTAAAGHALYTARLLPSPYWNSVAFVTEPTGHLVATFALEKNGTDFKSHNEWNLLASDDEWTAPIAAEVGPDGAVWVSDWYNYIVQHNPVPKGFENGKGNAYVTPLRDKTHGRIYRVGPVGMPTAATTIKLDPKDGTGLVAALANDNMTWRLTAQRLLVERANKDVVPALIELVRNARSDAIGLAPGAIHALWTLHGLGALDGSNPAATQAVFAALGHPSAGVRRNAVQVLPGGPKAAEAIRAAGLLEDGDPLVRLAALLALADAPPSPEAAEALVAALVDGKAEGDRWLPDAATAAAAANANLFLKALAAREFKQPASPIVTALASRVAEHMARGVAPGASAEIIVALSAADPGVTDAVIAGLARGWPKDKPPTLDDRTDRALVELLTKASPGARAQLVSLAGRWGSKAIEASAAEIATTFLASVADDKLPEPVRIDAAKRLVDFRPNDPKVVEALLGNLSPRTSQGLAIGLVDAVGQSLSPTVGPALVAKFAGMTPLVRNAAVLNLLSRAEWTSAFLDGVDRGDIALKQLSLPQTQALSIHPDATIASRAKALIARGGGLPDADRQKVIDEIARVALKGGDPTRGKVAFTQQCAKCHTYGGEGGKVGPDLTGMGTHPREELLIHILDPSRSVEGNFVQYSLATNDGRVLNGLLASESKTAVELLDAEGKSFRIPREEIEEFAASKKSLMPEGFEKQLGADGMADVLAFLTKRGKYLPLDLKPVANTITTRGMFFAPDSMTDRLVFRDWSPKTVENVPFLLVDPQGDKVANAVMLNGPYGDVPPKMPRSVTMPCNGPVRAIHFLSGISGWGALDDQAAHTTSMIVRLHYADGAVEDHPLLNGVHFADYIRVVDVPESKLAFRLRGQQIRYLSVRPKRSDTIRDIELVKGPDQTAPIVMAVTLEGDE